MRYRKAILPLMLSLFLLPPTVRAQAADSKAQQQVAPFRIVLSDGSLVEGLVSFVMHLDTQYGRISLSSGNLLSAKFGGVNQWVDLRLKDIRMRVKYNPATSDFAITSSSGPLSIDFAQVSLIESPDAQVADETPPPQPLPVMNMNNQQQPPAAPYDTYAMTPPPESQIAPDYYNPLTWPIYAAPQPDYCYPYGYCCVWCPGCGYITCFRDYRGRVHCSPRDFGRASSPSSFRGSVNSTFRGSASPTFRSAASSFSGSAPTFRTSAAPTFRSGATTTFRGAAASSFSSGGMQFGNTGGRSR
jgi:hypothetical protein